MTVVPDRERVVAPLEAFSTLPDWLAAAMDGERVAASLQHHAPVLRADHGVVLAWVTACRPERLRAKDGTWVARYRVTVRAGEAERDVVLVGELVPPPHQPTGPEVGDGAFVSDGDRHTHTDVDRDRHTDGDPDGAAGEWSCWLPDLRLRLRSEAGDPALPALPVLTHAPDTTRLLQLVLRRAGHPDAVIASCDPVVVRYKPGSRCTVVVGVTYADTVASAPPTTVVLKTHQGDKGQTAWAAMTALWARQEAWRGVVEMAEPLAFLPEERILVQGPVPEDLTLKELARRAFAGGDQDTLASLRVALAATGRGLAALHRSGAEYGRTATLADEVAEIREVVGRLSVTVPGLGGAAEPLLSRVEQLAGDPQPGPAVVPSHHDFRPAQVLLHEGSVGFIDFDGAAMAEPALDLGRFTAKLRDIGISSMAFTGQRLSGPVLRSHLALVDSLCEDFVGGYAAESGVSRERVLLWETCDLLTGLLHAWTKVRLARVGPRLTLLQHRVRALTDGAPSTG
ncbi:phosphotransferase family protein [Phycicoccus sp. Soil748]|uniref:phosphotransferase family protein n=1 Tax=Phycicoccus sp. Soil748 TaxID=1736397 RepID=UPI0007026F92|nr:phosphotransferase [Phycicoccus sp. Soil748]KRE55391.1 hypothetical protein ASG70_08425 [Phycicoccus sp. Soil748]